jgi:hypothetical protein
MSDVQTRINNSTARIDSMLAQIERSEAERQRAENAGRDEARRVWMRDNAERQREYGARYADSYAAFGVQMPPPIDNESAGAYRKRLYEGLRRKLPASNEWADVRADDIPPSAAPQIEAMVIKAALVEGLRPSPENLPRDGSLIRRERIDDMSGAKSIEWLGRESFIKQMGREGGRVLRICDPRTGIVHWGSAFDRVR